MYTANCEQQIKNSFVQQNANQKNNQKITKEKKARSIQERDTYALVYHLAFCFARGEGSGCFACDA